MKQVVRDGVGRALDLVRRGRIVAWTPHWMGFGNVLLLGQWAVDGRSRGEDRWILRTAALNTWLDTFPGLRSISLDRDEVRFFDQRVMPWSAAQRAKLGRHVVAPHAPIDVVMIERFIRAVLLPGSELPSSAHPSDHLVVNVRRGDYYSDPEIRKQYGFDLPTYLETAVTSSVKLDGIPSSITVVSDDIAWCQSELDWLNAVAPTVWNVNSSPTEDFMTVASARRAVLSNSTFSYWAAHVGNVLHGDNHASIWAPRFFDRTQNGGRSWLLDERWSIVEDLPGGWDESHQSPTIPRRT